MNKPDQRWGIVGGGMLGMQLARRLARQGRRVTILETGPALGGLARPWNLGPFAWDKFYHVILLSDTALLDLLDDIGLEREMNWVETKTGFYSGGQLYSMSDTLEFLKFPLLSLLDKFRLGGTIFFASRQKNWQKLENIGVVDWLRKRSGRNTFEKIWLPLLKAKLGDHYHRTSAVFIWATIQRMYAARRSGLKKEMFGYVNGGYARILEDFTRYLLRRGVRIKTNFRVRTMESSPGGGLIVRSAEGDLLECDEVIVTVPSEVAAGMCPGLSATEKEKHRQVEYLGVICVSALLKKSLSPFYVTNITDHTPFTGVIEMTNIVDPAQFDGLSLVYLPKYVKKDDPVFQWSDEEIIVHTRKNLLGMYDHLAEEDVTNMQVARAPYVFALPEIGYSRKLPPVSTSIPGLHILNSAHIYDATLNINETLRLVDRELPGIIRQADRIKRAHE